MAKMEFEKFKKQIKSLGIVYSIRDEVPYEILSVDDNVLKIKRESTGNVVRIKMAELYNFYLKENYYDTEIAKEYISGRVQSPAVAVLCALTENQN